MKRWWFPLLVLILLVAVLKYTANLRALGYDKVPDTYPILDERTNVWHGLSLRQSGIPAAWSGLGAYKRNNAGGKINGFNIQVDDFTPNLNNFSQFPKPSAILHGVDLGLGRGMTGILMVQPYLDHPPLAALIFSSFVPNSLRTFDDLTPFDMRKGPLVLAAITGFLIFLLGFQLFKNVWIGLLATAIYGTAPTFVLLSRYTLLENAMVPLMLISLNLLLFSQQVKNRKKVALTVGLAGVFGGLTALTKITGWAILPIGVILLWQWKYHLREILYFAFPVIVLGLSYFAWGFYLAPNVFIDIFRYQGIDRGFIGSINFLVTMTRVGIVNFPVDGWWIGGFLTMGLILLKKESFPYIVSVVTLLFTALLLGGANYPWYFIPLVPFMCLGIAYLIWQIVTSPSLFNLMAFFLLFFSSSFYWGYGVYQAALSPTGDQQPFTLYRILFLLFFGIGLMWPRLVKLNKVAKAWPVVVFCLILITLKLNERSLYFLMSNWGHLPAIFTPGTF